MINFGPPPGEAAGMPPQPPNAGQASAFGQAPPMGQEGYNPQGNFGQGNYGQGNYGQPGGFGQQQQTYGQQASGFGQPAASGSMLGQRVGDLDLNIACLICYALGIVSAIVMLVLEPYSKNSTIRFHAFQCLFAGGIMFVISLFSTVIGFILINIPIIGGVIGLLLFVLLPLAFLGLWIYLMVKCYQGETVVLPVIGPLAQKQAVS